MEREFKRFRQGKLNKELSILDKDNINIMKGIGEVEPKYAKHMFLRNELLKNFAMKASGGVDLLSQPVCTHCERPAAWDKSGSAYCFSCNKTVPAKDVITVMDYLMEHTKMFTEEQLEQLINIRG